MKPTHAYKKQLVVVVRGDCYQVTASYLKSKHLLSQKHVWTMKFWFWGWMVSELVLIQMFSTLTEHSEGFLFFFTTSHIHQSKHIFIVWFILCLEAFHALTLRWLHWGKLGVHYFAQGHFYMQTRETEDWTTTFSLVDKPFYPLTQSHPLKRPFILDCGVSTAYETRSPGSLSSSVFRGFFESLKKSRNSHKHWMHWMIFFSCCVIACTLMLPCAATFCYRLTRQPPRASPAGGALNGRESILSLIIRTDVISLGINKSDIWKSATDILCIPHIVTLQ